MPLYANIGGAQKELKWLYTNVDGTQKIMSEMHANISGAKKQIFTRLYTWAKYVSYRSGITYGDYTQSSMDRIDSLNIYPPQESIGIIALTSYDSEAKYYKFTYGTGFSYTNSSGKFALTGKQTDTLQSNISKSNYHIEQNYIGKYVYDEAHNWVFKITEHDDVFKLWLGYQCSQGDQYYKYQFKYDSDVTSTNPNAYTSGSPSSYTSTSANDIRTVYVKK